MVLDDGSGVVELSLYDDQQREVRRERLMTPSDGRLKVRP